MITMTTYKYKEGKNGYAVSPRKPDCEYTEAMRLIAEPGHALTKDGINYFYCIDVVTADGWLEIPGDWNDDGVFISADNATEADYLTALAELGVE